MKPPLKSLAQLNLPLLGASQTTLPADKHEQLIQALIELLWSAAKQTAGGGRKGEA